MYYLINPLKFSLPPLFQLWYALAKKKSTPSAFEMVWCTANSLPLSEVIVLRNGFHYCNILIFYIANSWAPFSLRFLIFAIPNTRSLMVRMAPLLSFKIIKSISITPIRSRLSTSEERSLMAIIQTLSRYRLNCVLRFSYSFPLHFLPLQTCWYIRSVETHLIPAFLAKPTICYGLYLRDNFSSANNPISDVKLIFLGFPFWRHSYLRWAKSELYLPERPSELFFSSMLKTD